jgi:recombination protein RecA
MTEENELLEDTNEGEVDLESDSESEDDVTKASAAIKRISRKEKEENTDWDDIARASRKSTWDQVVSTGSTLCDLAISGGRVRGGGIPGGFIIEIFADSGLGKTTLACTAAANAQELGGEIKIDDPECRLTPEYCDQMGVVILDGTYSVPRTVEDFFEKLVGKIVVKGKTSKRDRDNIWRPNPSKINIMVEDSLTALTTRMEEDKGDKMGQRRAKEFSEGWRLAKTHFRDHNITMICTNQIRDNVDSPYGGIVTSGGHATKFYSSCRGKLILLEVLDETNEVRGREQKEKIGIKVRLNVIKNSLDNNWRTADFYIIYNYGIDDIRANLQYLKDNGGFDEFVEGKWKKASRYIVNNKKYSSMNSAIKAVEDQNLENEIKNKVIDLWEEIQESFKVERKPKSR